MPGKVFGVDLQTLVDSQKTDIPKIVTHIVEFLHKKNAHLEEGIFRISGNNQRIAQLKKQFDTDGHVDLFKQKDIETHTAASLLKLFLRELPVPVIIPRYYSTFLKVYQNPDAKQRMINFRKLVLGLPKPNRLLLISVLGYLHVVSDNHHVNKMSTLNLALIFAPNLMKAEKETLRQIMEDSDNVAGTLQILIQEVDYVRTGEEPAWFSDYVKMLPRSKSFSSPPVPKNFKEQTNDPKSPANPNGDNDSFHSTTTSVTGQTDFSFTPTTAPHEESTEAEVPSKRRSVNRSLSFTAEFSSLPIMPTIREEVTASPKITPRQPSDHMIDSSSPPRDQMLDASPPPRELLLASVPVVLDRNIESLSHSQVNESPATPTSSRDQMVDSSSPPTRTRDQVVEESATPEKSTQTPSLRESAQTTDPLPLPSPLPEDQTMENPPPPPQDQVVENPPSPIVDIRVSILTEGDIKDSMTLDVDPSISHPQIMHVPERAHPTRIERECSETDFRRMRHSTAAAVANPQQNQVPNRRLDALSRTRSETALAAFRRTGATIAKEDYLNALRK